MHFVLVLRYLVVFGLELTLHLQDGLLLFSQPIRKGRVHALLGSARLAQVSLL